MASTGSRNHAARRAQWLAFLFLGCVALTIGMVVAVSFTGGGWSHWATVGIVLGFACLAAFVRTLITAIDEQRRIAAGQ